mmetsp:Transcript_7728/g.22004  ORF Transcript_7728/g.22004 Transcript_7728/m.22004 type:complete len:273 (+) Transcript_7728:968-1786(+)
MVLQPPQATWMKLLPCRCLTRHGSGQLGEAPGRAEPWPSWPSVPEPQVYSCDMGSPGAPAMTATCCMPEATCVAMSPESAPLTRMGVRLPSQGGTVCPSNPEATVEPHIQTFPPTESMTVKCSPAAICRTDSGPGCISTGSMRPSSSPTPKQPLSPPPHTHTTPRSFRRLTLLPCRPEWPELTEVALEAACRAGSMPAKDSRPNREVPTDWVGSFCSASSALFPSITRQAVCHTPQVTEVTFMPASFSTFLGCRQVSMPPWPSLPPNPSPQV